jgi:hypothetical protein
MRESERQDWCKKSMCARTKHTQCIVAKREEESVREKNFAKGQRALERGLDVDQIEKKREFKEKRATK